MRIQDRQLHHPPMQSSALTSTTEGGRWAQHSPHSWATSRDYCTYPSASNFFLFSMICRESRKSCYPQGIWLPTTSRGAAGCQICLGRAAASPE